MGSGEEAVTPEEQVLDWNEKHPVGTPVLRYQLANPRRMFNPEHKPHPTVTTSHAFLKYGQALIRLRSHAGWHSLDTLEVINARPEQA